MGTNIKGGRWRENGTKRLQRINLETVTDYEKSQPKNIKLHKLTDDKVEKHLLTKW